MTHSNATEGGGQFQEAPGTCEACVWGRGEHSPECVTLLPAVPAIDEHTLWLVSPRKCTQIIGPDGVPTWQWEPEEQWGRRCAVIKNIGEEKP